MTNVETLCFFRHIEALECIYCKARNGLTKEQEEFLRVGAARLHNLGNIFDALVENLPKQKKGKK